MSRKKRKRFHKRLKEKEKLIERFKKEGEKMNDKDLERMKQQEQEEKEEKKGIFAFLGRHKFGTSVSALALAASISLSAAYLVNREESKIKNIDSLPKHSASDSVEPTPEVNVPETPVMEKPNVLYSTKELTNEDVIVTIQSNEELKALAGWNLSEDEKALSKSFAENGFSSVIVTSKKGATSKVEIVVNNIDNTFAVSDVKYSTTALTNGTVTATISSNEELQAVKGWALSSDRKSISKTFTKNGSETIELKDLAGNALTRKVVVDNIDNKFDPLEVKYSEKELTNKDVIVTISSNEQIQEIKGWTLSKDKKSAEKTYDKNGSETVIVKDLAGNTQTVEVVVPNIDKEFSAPTVSYSTTLLTNGNVKVTITSNEPMQAIEGWTLSNDKKSAERIYTKNVSKQVVTVKDLAGNAQTVEINIDNIDNTFNIASVHYKQKSSTSVEVTIYADEEIQGVKGWTLSKDKKSIKKTYYSNKEETITLKDKANNSQEVTVKVDSIKEYSSSDSYSPGGSTGGNTGGSTGGDNNGGNTGGDNNGGNTGGDNNGGNTGGDNNGGNTGGSDTSEEEDRNNTTTDDKSNTGVGDGGTTGDTDVELYNSIKEELEQLYVMKEVLETVKVGDLEFEYPVRKLTM